MNWLFFVAMSFVYVACSDEQAGLVSDDLIPARIAGVIDYGDDGGAVVLRGKDSPPVSIVIRHCEARALRVAMQDEDFPRPLSYDLLEEILENVDGEVTRLVVHTLKDIPITPICISIRRTVSGCSIAGRATGWCW